MRLARSGASDRFHTLLERLEKLTHDSAGNERRDSSFSTTELVDLSELVDEIREVREKITGFTKQIRSIRDGGQHADTSKRRDGESLLDWQKRQVGTIEEARRKANLGGGMSSASVKSEPMVYGANEDFQSEHSYWADRFTIEKYGRQHPGYDAAMDRRNRWGHQVEYEISHRTKFGLHAETELREHYRETLTDAAAMRQAIEEARSRGRVSYADKADGLEARATGTGGGASVSATSGASAFILPYIAGPYVVYREYGRSFADQCAKPPMPEWGMGIYKPQVVSGAGVGAYTELGTVTEVDPSVGFLAGALGIYSGQVVLAQAVLDRTSPDFRYDLMVSDQIARKEAPILDAYVIAKAISNGATAIAYTSTFAVASTSGVSNSLYGHVSQAKATMRKTAGAVLNPTHVWMDPERWEVVAAWGDANGRPVTIPEYAGPFQALAAGSADGDAGVEGATGYRFNGLRAFTDPNLPTTGGTANLDQVLVCCMPEVEYYEGAPVDRILPQTLASNLETIIQRYRYLTVIENYSAATQPIQGAAFAAPSWGS